MVDDGDSELFTAKKDDVSVLPAPKESEVAQEPVPAAKPTKVNPSKPKRESAAPSAPKPAQPSEAANPPSANPPSANPPSANPYWGQYAAPPAFDMSSFYTSALPTVPDAEEQEYLSQLLLAWYQAGYAAGRYMMVRQRKQCFVFYKHVKHNEIKSQFTAFLRVFQKLVVRQVGFAKQIMELFVFSFGCF